MKRVVFVLLCLAATACASRYADFFPYFDNGTKKPSFTMLPIYNETTSPLANDFPTDLSKAVRNRLKRTGKTYSPPISQMQRELGSMSIKELGSTSDLKKFSRFKGTDFVVLMETVDCSVVPYSRGAIKPLYSSSELDPQSAKVLMIAVRLEIINMKGLEPKVARMELVKSNHMVSQDTLERAEKGSKTALETIRSRLAIDLAQKIEETVCVKK